MTNRNCRKASTRFIKIFATICLICAGSFSLYAQALPAQPFTFSWAAIDGAGGYLAEIRNANGNVVTSQKAKASDTSVTFNLVPGPYSLRLTTLNHLGTTESSSDWLPIHVAAPAAPKLLSLDVQNLTVGKAQGFTLSAEGLAADASISLVSPAGSITKVAYTQPIKNQLTVQVPALTEAGAYTLVLTNPLDLSIFVENKIRVRYPALGVDKIEASKIFLSDPHPSVIIYGHDFSPEIKATLWPADATVNYSASGSQPEKAQTEALGIVVPLRLHTSRSLIIDLPKDMNSGKYNVLLTNADNETPFLAGKIEIVGQPKPATLVTNKGQGIIGIHAQSSGTLYLDGVLSGPLSAGDSSLLNVADGEHTIEVRYDDGYKEAITLTVIVNQTSNEYFDHIRRVASVKPVTPSDDDYKWNQFEFLDPLTGAIAALGIVNTAGQDSVHSKSTNTVSYAYNEASLQNSLLGSRAQYTNALRGAGISSIHLGYEGLLTHNYSLRFYIDSFVSEGPSALTINFDSIFSIKAIAAFRWYPVPIKTGGFFTELGVGTSSVTTETIATETAITTLGATSVVAINRTPVSQSSTRFVASPLIGWKHIIKPTAGKTAFSLQPYVGCSAYFGLGVIPNAGLILAAAFN